MIVVMKKEATPDRRRAHGPADRVAGPESPRDRRHRADRDRRHRRRSQDAQGIAGKRPGRGRSRADPGPLQNRQPRSEARADRGPRRQPDGRQRHDRRHRRPVLGRKRRADSGHGQGRQGGRRHGPARRRVQAAHQPLQLSRAEGRRARSCWPRPARRPAWPSSPKWWPPRTWRWSPGMPTCCKSAPATCRTIACWKRSARPIGRCCSSAAPAPRSKSCCWRPSTFSTPAIRT